MAKTANKGFFLRKSLMGQEAPSTVDILLDDSTTFTVGDLVRVNDAGLLTVCATGTVVGGVLTGIVDQDGVSVFSPRAQGTSGATITGDDTVATSSTNSTDVSRYLKGQITIDPAGYLLYYNDADSALAQTNLFQFFDVDSGDQVTVGSASEANGQVQLIQIDPDGDGDASKGLFRINENQFSMGIDTATAKVAS